MAGFFRDVEPGDGVCRSGPMRATASGNAAVRKPYVRDDPAVGVVVEVKKITRAIPKRARTSFVKCAEFPQLVDQIGDPFEPLSAEGPG